MDLLPAAERLAALGHDARLAIFRLLVQAGPAGLSAGEIGEAVGMAPNTLSFHLSHLSRVSLIEGRRESRFIHYTARFGAMNELIGFLTENCCQGEPCLPARADCAPAARHAKAARPAVNASAVGTDCGHAPAERAFPSSRKKSRP